VARRREPKPTRRQQQILAAVVSEHVRTGQPVGSRTTCARYGITASSATVRNEMVALTEMGLIEQPHTSAGRLPTDSGYRYFVEHLMDQEQLDSREAAWIKGELRRSAESLLETAREAARLLSTLLHGPAVVMAPREPERHLEHFHASPVSSTNVLLVCVTAEGQVENRLVEMPVPVTSQQLRRMSEILNSRFAGAEVGALSRMDIDEIRSEMGDLALPSAVMQAIRRGLEKESEHDIHLEGVVYILQDPDFSHAVELQRTIETLYQERVLRDLLRPVTQERRICIRIGAENSVTEARSCGVVAMSYQDTLGVRGVVAALGPRRMPYWRAIPAVACVADELTEHLSQCGEDG
jgi:heat-inducible transcriptional repressor